MENFFKNAIDAAARGVDNLKVASQRGYVSLAFGIVYISV